MPSLNLLFRSKTDARLMRDGRKAVWSITYVSVAFFPSLKHNFIAYRSSKVSSHLDCIFEIHQLWQSDFSRVYSNYRSCCSFESEIIKIGQSSHKMCSNNIVNSQESTTILNASTKIVWKLIEGPTYLYLCCILSYKYKWKHNQTWFTTSMNERNTSLWKYISHFILIRGPLFDVSWEIDGETYTQREGFFFLEPGGFNACSPLQARQRRPDQLRVPRSTTIFSTLSKSARVVITWSPSCYTPVRPERPNAPSSSCLLIKTWQLAKAHRVTRNEPKIHGMLYNILNKLSLILHEK